jgi:phage baseplate assembly protein W
MPKLSSFTALVGNTLWNLGGSFQFDFNAKPNTVEEVLQNVYEIWSVPLASQPYLRQFGNDVSWIDTPGNIAQMQMQTAFLVACARWEPRAKFTKIEFASDTANYIRGVYSLYVELEVDLSVQISNDLFSGPQPSESWVVDNTAFTQYPVVRNENLTL